MSFEKYLQHNFFMSGVFFQIDWYNPLFLDKTGLAIGDTREKLVNWNGTPKGFEFVEKEGLYNGNISIHKLWFKDNKQNYFDEISLNQKIQEYIDNTLFLVETYSVYDFKRIGIRLQGILDKNDEVKINNYNNILSTLYGSISESYKISTENIVSIIEIDNFKVRNSLSFVTKATNTVDGPNSGFMIDMDFYIEYKNKDIDEIKNELAYLHDKINEHYKSLLEKSIEVIR